MCVNIVLVPNSVIDIVMIMTSVLWLLETEWNEILYRKGQIIFNFFTKSIK